MRPNPFMQVCIVAVCYSSFMIIQQLFVWWRIDLALTIFTQMFYVTLILGGYYLFIDDCFPFIKPPYMPEYYRYEANTQVCFCGNIGSDRWGAHIGVPFTLLVWLKCCLADPGVVKKSTEALYLKSFPYDDLLYAKKSCDTCKIVRYGTSYPPPPPHHYI